MYGMCGKVPGIMPRGTSFLFIVMIISIIFFIFIRVESPALRVLFRILLVPGDRGCIL